MAVLLLKWFLFPLWLSNPFSWGTVNANGHGTPSHPDQATLHTDPEKYYSVYLNKHPYYVSVSELEWNQKNKEIEISIKIYSDDFEEALKQPGAKVDLVKADATKNRGLIETYIRKHFQLRVNGTPIQLNIVGYENDQEATWSYFQSPCTEPPVKIEITNTILYESKKEQVNIVHLKSVQSRKSFRLVNPESVIEWNPGK